MNRHLQEMINSIAVEYETRILHEARNYIEIDIGRRLESMGFSELGKKYAGINAVVPLEDPLDGMKVMTDGRTFKNYVQYESGIAVPAYLAEDIGLPYKAFVPNESMILNFT